MQRKTKMLKGVKKKRKKMKTPQMDRKALKKTS